MPPTINETVAPPTNKAPPTHVISEHQILYYSFEYLFSESTPPPLPPPIVTHSFSAIEHLSTIQQMDDCNKKILKLEERTDALVAAQKSLSDTNKLLDGESYVLGGSIPVECHDLKSCIPSVPVSNHNLQSRIESFPSLNLPVQSYMHVSLLATTNNETSTPLLPPEVVIEIPKAERSQQNWQLSSQVIEVLL